MIPWGLAQSASRVKLRDRIAIVQGIANLGSVFEGILNLGINM